MSTTPNQPTPFTFSTAGKIIFGCGVHQQIGPLAAELGKNILLVHGQNVERISPMLKLIKQNTMSILCSSCTGEPTLSSIRKGLELARAGRIDLIIGIGGGSVLDTGKALAALITNPGDPLDYLEIIGQGKTLEYAPLPYIAVPTTSGTGAEVTANAVIGSPEHHLKVSLRNPQMLPDIALIDPELTVSAPPEVTILTGMDALTQVLEPFVSHLHTPLTDLFCQDGIQRALKALPLACRDGSNLDARSEMSLVSLYGGLALANAKLGAVHGIAGPFGGMYDAPHGGVCAALLPHVMAVNIETMLSRDAQNPALVRYQQIASMVTGSNKADIHQGPEHILTFCQQFNVPGLAAYGLQLDSCQDLIEAAQNSSSMKGNPITLTREEIFEILRRAL